MVSLADKWGQHLYALEPVSRIKSIVDVPACGQAGVSERVGEDAIGFQAQTGSI
jgi:hypothetical protein